MFAAFPDATGVEILEHFAAADMSSIRNKSGYLKGVMNRFRISEKKEKRERKSKEESGVERAAAAEGDRCSVFACFTAQFACFTGTKVQILTCEHADAAGNTEACFTTHFTCFTGTQKYGY